MRPPYGPHGRPRPSGVGRPSRFLVTGPVSVTWSGCRASCPLDVSPSVFLSS